MFIEKLKKTNNEEYLLNNLNDFIIEIDYFDNKGIKKRKNKVPLKYIFNSKLSKFQASIWYYIFLNNLFNLMHISSI